MRRVSYRPTAAGDRAEFGDPISRRPVRDIGSTAALRNLRTRETIATNRVICNVADPFDISSLAKNIPLEKWISSQLPLTLTSTCILQKIDNKMESACDDDILLHTRRK